MDHVLLSLRGAVSVPDEASGEWSMRYDPDVAERAEPPLDDWLFADGNTCCHQGVQFLLQGEQCPWHQLASRESEKTDD